MTPAPRAWWVRLLVSLGAGFSVAVLVAIALTVVDLYLAGHGMLLIGRPWLDVDQLGVHLSRADVVFLAAALLAAGFAWRATAAGSS
jgi:hypothetical protein